MRGRGDADEVVPMIIGNTLGSSSGGLIDDLRVSNTALYTRDTAPFTPQRYLSVRGDTVAFLDFNSEASGIILDVTGNGQDAEIVNGTLVQDYCHLP